MFAVRMWGVGAVLLGTALLASPASAGRDHDWVGVEKCRSCHEKQLMGDQVAAWSAGPHRRAYETLASAESLAIAERLGLDEPPQQSDACLGCHVSAHGVSPLRVAHPVEPADGVQCESCHGPGRDYRKKRIMSDAKKATRKGLWRVASEEAICTACHNSESPTFDAGRYQRPDGSSTGFDFEQAKTRYPHAIPADVKGRYVELEEAEKAAKKAKEPSF